MGGNELAATEASEAPKASLGKSLITARERRGLSREMVVEQTHIPAHYVQMLEDNDYRRIADQLYLLPFLRKYAEFLDIDPDESAMRLLREVQRIDNSPPPARLDAPLDGRRYRRRNWSRPIIFGGLVAVIVGAYIVQSRYAETDNTVSATRVNPSLAASGPASSLALKGTTNSWSAVEPSSAASAYRLDSSVAQQTSLARTSTHPDTELLPQAVVTQARSRADASNAERQKWPGYPRVRNH